MAVAGLIADIGATNARFALVRAGRIEAEQVLRCADYPDLAAAMGAYLQGQPGACPSKAAVAIAGPVSGDFFEMTNHPWRFSVEETRKALGFESLRLMNDFAALALAIPHLTAGDLRQIGGGAPAPGGAIGVIGPGTGLGVAGLVAHGGAYIAVPGEGGHVTMPARSQREFDVFQQLLKDKYHHVSAERVCSGKGLVNLYEALRALDGREDLPPGRTPEEISEAAQAGSCALCREALDLMLGFLGRVAGNLALTLGSTGGIYIAGGIPQRLGAYFDGSSFYREFVEKGRFRDYMGRIPVFMIIHPFPAFVGLAADLAKK